MTPTALRVAQTPEEAAYVFLEQARQQLAQHNTITPLAVLVREENHHQAYDLVGLIFTDQTKGSAFGQVVSMAKTMTAKAIITVAEGAHWRTDEGQAPKDCVFVTVSGPGMETITMHLPFTRSWWRKEISFGELDRQTQATPPTFLPDWP
jgi:hypothetical protein